MQTDTAAAFAIHICTASQAGRREESRLIVYRELSSLVHDLGISARTLYAVSNRLDQHYRRAELPKADGGVRVLSVPDPLLKHIQRRITQVLLVHMPISPCATAYRYGGSVLVNAAPHVGQSAVLRLDIQRFFDSIRYTSVKEAAFPADIYAEPLRILLSMLCYHREGLPQGAPSSPAISNIVMADFDAQVSAWCRERGLTYTRYCDDMTFSGALVPSEVVSFVSDRLRPLGLFLNRRKTRYLPSGRRQLVTGIVVNQTLNTPAEYRRKLRQELHFCQKYGVAAHMARQGLTCSEDAYLARLLGQVNYALQISPGRSDLEQARAWLRAGGGRTEPHT